MNKIRKYSCMVCGGKVEKPPCIAPPPAEKNHKGQTNKIAFTYNGLHGWRCDTCGPTKVKCELKEYQVNG